jgi:hypothetical protein
MPEDYNCNKCKFILKNVDMKTYHHRCEMCHKIYCRKCDDCTEDIMWRDSGDIETPDRYLCEECHSIKKILVSK